MSVSHSGVKAYDDAVRSAELTRQNAVKAAGNAQSAVTSSEIAYARAGFAAAIANNCGTECWTTLLKQLGVQT